MQSIYIALIGCVVGTIPVLPLQMQKHAKIFDSFVWVANNFRIFSVLVANKFYNTGCIFFKSITTR
jgi:hypothetical protein